MSAPQYFTVGFIYLAIMTASWIAMTDRESDWFEVGMAVSSLTFFHGVLYFNYLGVERRRSIVRNTSFLDTRISPIGEWATLASFLAVGSVLIVTPPSLANAILELNPLAMVGSLLLCLPLLLMLGPKKSAETTDR